MKIATKNEFSGFQNCIANHLPSHTYAYGGNLAHQDCSLGFSKYVRNVDSCFVLIYCAHAIVALPVVGFKFVKAWSD